MTASPKLVLDEESVETILALPSATRRRLLAVLYQLPASVPRGHRGLHRERFYWPTHQCEGDSPGHDPLLA